MVRPLARTCAAILAGVLVSLSQPVQANVVTVTCGAPMQSGGTGFALGINVLGVEKSVNTIITPGNIGATGKCALLASALQTQIAADPLLSVSGIVVSTSGATLTIDAGSDFIDKAVFGIDTTKEFTTLSSNLAPGELVKIDETLANPTGIPPAGFYSGVFVYTPIFGTFGASANGVDNGESVVSALNNNFGSNFGIPFGPITPDGSLLVSSTGWFDPTTVSIGWDGNTALYLANFGLEFRPAPEPATLALLGVGLAGFGFARRRKLK